jgi:Peptidase inhibitor I78 family
MESLDKHVGKELTPELKAKLENQGVRVHTPGSVFTADFNPFRQNAEVKDNVITRIYQG